MKRSLVGIAVVLGIAATVAAMAGAKCTWSTQECLDFMADRYRNKGWAGLLLDQDESGALTVKLVIEGSPAQAAGFKPGDKLLAIAGQRFGQASEEAIRKTWMAMAPGDKVAYTISRDGRETNIDVTLAKMPEEEIARAIGLHMLEHAAPPQK